MSRKLREKKSRKMETGHTNEIEDTIPTKVSAEMSRKLREKKSKKMKTSQTDEIEDTISTKVSAVGEPRQDKLPKRRKKNKENVEIIQSKEKKGASEKCNDSKPKERISNYGVTNKGVGTARKTKKGKSKNPDKTKKNYQLVSTQITTDLPETREESAEEEVYQMSSGDEDYSKGMKKWVTQYHQTRPGLKVLQERIDDFMTAHEAREEQARKEKLAEAAEGGWTVVVHQKGRKKTTEAESGTAVGSVAQAAVLDKMGKKKKKEVGLDFYQFNKREAHRSEIMMLQSKFEQDKKRIQQMRAARKFRPY